MDADPWMMFRPAADAFNSNRSALIKSGLTINLDESMCPHRPRFTKTGLRYHGAPLASARGVCGGTREGAGTPAHTHTRPHAHAL